MTEKLLPLFVGKWVACTRKYVLATGETAQEMIDNAAALGYSTEDYVMYSVPKPGTHIY